MDVLRHPDAGKPEFSYASMLQEYVTITLGDPFSEAHSSGSIWRQFRSTASTGACNRFVLLTAQGLVRGKEADLAVKLDLLEPSRAG